MIWWEAEDGRSTVPSFDYKTNTTDACRNQQVFNPAQRLAAISAQSEKRALLSTGKGNEEGVQFLDAIRRKAPPRLIVKPVEDHRVELKALALMDRHKRNLPQSLELVQSIGPCVYMLKALLEKQHESIPDTVEIGLALIGGKGLPQCLVPDKVEGGACGLCRRIRYGIKTPQHPADLSYKDLKALLEALLSRSISRVDRFKMLQVPGGSVPVVGASCGRAKAQQPEQDLGQILTEQVLDRDVADVASDVSEPDTTRFKGRRKLGLYSVSSHTHKDSHIMRLDIAQLDFTLNPLRESVALLVAIRIFPDSCNVTINEPLGAGLSFLDSGIDPSCDDMLNPDKI